MDHSLFVHSLSSLLWLPYFLMHDCVRFSSHGEVSSDHNTDLSLSENMISSGCFSVVAMRAGLGLGLGLG